VDDKPPPVKLDYAKAAEVFPTAPKAATIFWLVVGLFVCVLALIFAVSILMALFVPHLRR